MAVVSPSSSSSSKEKKSGKCKSKVQTQTADSGCSTQPQRNQKRPRNNSPGVRLVHNRIYDSHNGKTCHQCRQKTVDFAASCKQMIDKQKQCTFHFCHKCLLNRYGEKAEEVALLNDWTCPRCRGICNCSFCMKKRGHQPTGPLVYTAKANGFASVSDMLQLNNSETSASQEAIDVALPSRKRKAADKESEGKKPAKSRKVSSVNGPNGSTQAKDETTTTRNTRLTRSSSISKETSEGNDETTATRNTRLTRSSNKNISKENSSKETSEGNDETTATRNTRLTRSSNKNIAKENSSEETSEGNDEMTATRTTRLTRSSNKNIAKENSSKETSEGSCGDFLTTIDKKAPTKCEGEVPSDAGPVAKNKPISKSPNCKKKNAKVKSDAEILLPQGIQLNCIADIDLPVEDIGHALQFLEFCKTFGKVLNMRKGQSILLLEELVTGQSKRRLRHSSLAQFHIQLLSVMQKDTEKEYPCLNQNISEISWFKVLREYISESQYALKQQLLDFLDVSDDGYDQLDSSKKLRLLNFLCDEALGTTDFRSWIDEQNSEFVEKEKKAKGQRLAQREKERNLEKQMKKKLLDEIAKATLMKNGAPLSISENEELVQRIKSEVAQTLEVARTLASASEVSETVLEVMPKEDCRLDAVRSEAIFREVHGHKFHKFWRVGGCSDETDILLQEIEGRDPFAAKERWYTYGTEQKAIVEKYISSFRKQR